MVTYQRRKKRKPVAKSSETKEAQRVGINKYGIDVSRLRHAMKLDRAKLEAFRKKRFLRIQKMLGTNYSDNAAAKRRPINLLALFIAIHHRQLAAGRPACIIQTTDDSLKPTAADFEIRMNERVEEIGLEYTVKSWVLDALLGIGIVKCGWAAGDEVELDGEKMYRGESFAECVHLDDWSHDMAARKWYETQYEADRYPMVYDAFKGSSLFENKEGLQATPNTSNNEQGDPRVKSMSGADDYSVSRLEKTIELWDVFLPHHQKVVTIPAEGGRDPVRVVDWKGPVVGPYHKLCYGDVPDNTMPLPPTANLVDLDDLANLLLNKAGQQSSRQKTIGTFMGNDEDAVRINKTKDGEWCNIKNPGGVKEMKFGGPDAVILAFFLQVKDMFNYEAHNMDSVGGLSPQSRTLGQDQMLQMSASQGLAEMQDRTSTATGRLLKSIGWYEWNDPATEKMIYKKVPGYDFGVHVLWSPMLRLVPFEKFKIEFQPYSMMHTTPQMKLQAITMFLTNYLAPFAQQMAAQGKSINFDYLKEIAGKFTNTPELENVLTSLDQQTMMMMSGGGGGEGMDAGMSPVTSRTYNRTNTPSATRSGKDNVMMRALIGQASQESETAQLSR